MHSLRHVAWLRGLEALQQCRGHFVTQFCICAASICCLCKFVPHNLSVGGRWGRCGLSRICTAEAPSADFVVAPSSFVRSVSAIYACEIDVERCLGRDPVVGRCLRGYGRHGSHVYPCCPMAWRHFCSSVVQGLFQSECGRLIGSFANSFACVAAAPHPPPTVGLHKLPATAATKMLSHNGEQQATTMLQQLQQKRRTSARQRKPLAHKSEAMANAN